MKRLISFVLPWGHTVWRKHWWKSLLVKSKRMNNCTFQMTNLILLLPYLKISLHSLHRMVSRGLNRPDSSRSLNISCSFVRLFCIASVIFFCLCLTGLLILTDPGYIAIPHPELLSSLFFLLTSVREQVPTHDNTAMTLSTICQEWELTFHLCILPSA